MLTDLQRVVLAQMRQRHWHTIAEQAEHCWRCGQRSYLDARVRCPRWLQQLFFEANDEVLKAVPKAAEPSASELFAWRRRHGRVARTYEWKIVPVREGVSPSDLSRCDTPAQAVDYWHGYVATAPHFSPECECFATLLLTTKKRIRGHHLVSMGMLNETMAHPREAFRAAVIGGAHSVVMMHNHPSGDSDPSSADVHLTKLLKDAGRLLRIDVIDHIIVGHERHCSFREAGLI